MTTANKLTLLRMALIPVFLGVLYAGFPGSRYVALGVFIAASLTDTLDGYLARKYNQITVFGKFMDPLADKLLVCSALIGLISLGRIPSWAVMIIVGRDFIISGFRLVAAERGVVIAASWWGKIKTVVQMIMVIALVFHFPGSAFAVLEQVLIWLALALTVISLADYLYKNRHVLAEVH